MRGMGIDSETAGTGLRGRRRMATEADIELAALGALEASGFDELTMDQIAAAAGVSVRTAFRYFPTKVDTVLHTARQVGETLSSSIATGSALREVEDSIAAGLDELVRTRPRDVERLRRLRTLMVGDARLRAEVAKAEGYLAGLDVAGGEPASLERRLFLEIVAATLRSAFDSWAADGDATGEQLPRHYQRAREIRSTFID